MTKLETINAADLQNRTYEQTPFLVDELIPEGLHILAGAPKIGKSWLALWLCLCVAQGQALWNFATTQGEVLYLSLEDSFQRIQTRLFDLTEDAPPTLHETYFKLIIATGMRRGECCALKWEDINYAERSVHVCRNAVKTTGDEIIVKAPKTTAGNRYVYFSAEMESLLREYEAFCASETERYDRREQTKDDYVFRRKGMKLPMTPSTFTWRFKKILKANDLPTDLNVHSLRHAAASLFIASGTDVGTVAGLLGHSQPSTTLDVYTHAFDKNKKAASQIMQSSLEI